LSGIELKYTGKNSTYTFNPIEETIEGPFFILFKTFEEAVTAALGQPCPSDAAIKGFIGRASSSRNQATKPDPKKRSFVA
jgi:hypothetical protein